MTCYPGSDNVNGMARSVILLVIPALVLIGCSRSNEGSREDGGPAASSERAVNQPRPRRPRPPPTYNKTPQKLLVSASEVLIQYKGARNSEATRTKEEARAKAQELLERAQKGEPFERLASRFSDGTTKRIGGFLGTFPPDTRDPAVTKALLSVGQEELVPRVVETPSGFHVLRREKVVHIGHVLVMHTESEGAHTKIKRTRKEAREEAERLRERLAAEGADFGAIARKSSDCRLTKLIGGDLGYYGRGGRGYRGGRLMPELAKAVARLGPGEVSKVTETPYGFHVAWRYPDEEPGRSPGAKTPAKSGAGAAKTPAKSGAGAAQPPAAKAKSGGGTTKTPAVKTSTPGPGKKSR